MSYICPMTRNTKKLVFNSVRAVEIFKEEGRTTEWLAGKCKVTAKTIRECLAGTKNPSMAVVALMEIALNCVENELLSESKDQAA